MKSLELTKEHQIKLVKMGEALFPDYAQNKETGYGGMCFHHHGKYPGMLFGFKADGADGDLYAEASLYMHWFEFCSIHLIERLNEVLGDKSWEDMPEYVANIYPITKKGRWNVYTRFHFHFPKERSQTHPVDWLYIEFKKYIN